MKNKKLVIGLAAALIVLIAAFGIVWKVVLPKTSFGSKEIVVTIVYPGSVKKDYKIETKGEYLADALFEEGLITEDECKTGFVTAIDGIETDFAINSTWWCIMKDGEMISLGINKQPIADGDKFEIEYKLG